MLKPVWLLILLFLIPGLCAQTATLRMDVNVSPFLNIIVKPSEIRFHAAYEPGIYEAEQEVMLSICGNYDNWSVQIVAGELTGEKTSIAPSKLFIQNDHHRYSLDDGAGNGFRCMDSPVILSGNHAAYPEIRIKLRFKIMTRYDDPPGTYTGEIKLISTVLP